VTAGSAWALALALWVGCLRPGPWWLAPVGVLGLGAALLPADDRRRLLAAIGALGVMGVGLAGVRVDLAQRSQLAGLAAVGGTAEVVGVLVTEVRASELGAWAVVRVTTLDGLPVRERASVRLLDPGSGPPGGTTAGRPPAPTAGTAPGTATAPAPALGDEVTLRATARPLANEGFDAHLRRLHAVAELTPLADPVITARAGPLWRVTSWVRVRARTVAHARLDADRASVLTGVLIGDITGQDPQRRAELAAAGLTHLVVVSGRHVGLLLAGVLGGAALLGAGARRRRLAGLAALGCYVLLVRWQPSVLRAGVMATLVLGAGLLGRRADARHSLAAAVLVLLLVDPLLAGHLGFGLSVSATAGVLVGAPWLAPRIPGPRPVAVLVAASLGAQIGAAPLLLSMEQGVALASVPANLVAVPLAAVAQAIGLVAVLVGIPAPTIGGLLAQLAAPPLAGILAVAAVAADGPTLDWGLVASPVAVVLVTALVARRRAPRLALGALVGVVVLSTLPVVRAPAPVTTLTVTALDVGQGDAVLVEVPDARGGARLLVDGGGDERLALRRLRERRVRALDAVLVSHPHHDHTGGLPAVLESLPVGVLLVGPTPLDPASGALSAAQTELVARQRGIPLRRVSAGQRLQLGVASVDVLSPPADGSLAFDLNESSVVVRIGTEDGAVLLTGDAEVAAQTRLLRQPAQLRSQLLKVPHHGGATNAPGFLAAVGASDALITVGADNTYGHPNPAVLAELDGVRVHRTDEDGSVTVRVTTAGVQRQRHPRPPLHSRPCRVRRCTCSPAPRSCSCAGPPTRSSRSSRRRDRSRSSTSEPLSSQRAGSPTSGPVRCSASGASCSSARHRTCRPS
jgi:competence protein ComEC